MPYFDEYPYDVTYMFCALLVTWMSGNLHMKLMLVLKGGVCIAALLQFVNLMLVPVGGACIAMLMCFGVPR